MLKKAFMLLAATTVIGCLPIDDPASYTGVAKLSLKNDLKSCTGFLVDTGNDKLPAQMLTAGHCMQDTGPTVVDLDPENFGEEEIFYSSVYTVFKNESLPPEETNKAIFFAAESQKNKQVPVEITTVKYSTMMQQDVAVIELGATLGALKKKGIKPLQLNNKPSLVGSAVMYVGAIGGEFLKVGQCKQGGITPLIEGPWSWIAAQSNDCKGIAGGVSGSPLIDVVTQKVVGIVTTGVQTLEDTVICSQSAPCEVTKSKTAPLKDRFYSMPVSHLASCFSKAGFNLSSSCGLPARSGPTVNIRVVDNLLNSNLVQNTPANPKPWKFQGADLNALLWKTFQAGKDSCFTSVGYGYFDTKNSPLMHTTEGVYLACFKNRQGDITQHPLQVDNSPPTTTLTFSIQSLSDNLGTLLFISSPLGGESYQIEYQTGESMQACELRFSENPKPYTMGMGITAAVGENIVCYKVADLAGNISLLKYFTIPPASRQTTAPNKSVNGLKI
jgi:hypothetical protein